MIHTQGKRVAFVALLLSLISALQGCLPIAAVGMTAGAMIASDRRDAEALAGLGDAEFGRAHYLSAGTAYRRALQYDSAAEDTKKKLAVVEEIVRLDPTARGLGTYTRLGRSRELVKRASNDANRDHCSEEHDE